MKLSVFSDVNELWRDVLSSLLRQPMGGSRVGDSQRMLGVVFRLSDPRQVVLVNDQRKFSPRYAAAEFMWYLNANAMIDQIEYYCPGYGRYAEDSHGAYGRRVVGNPAGNQLEEAARLLWQSPESRRAVVSIWTAEDLFDSTRLDVPCNNTWSFYVQDGKLNMIATMRSNDAWLGMPNDIFANCCVLMTMAKLVGCKLGWYQHQVGDLHLYSKDAKKAQRALEETPGIGAPLKFDSTSCGWQDVEDMLHCEHSWRVQGATERTTDPFFNSLLELL
jgi:thymidylate synthase